MTKNPRKIWTYLIALLAGCAFLARAIKTEAMTFTWRDSSTIVASGPIEKGDAGQFAALSKFNTLELNSPGGLVIEALRIVANMDARGGISTVVRTGSTCASACAMALFVSGETRIVYMGGRIGIHSAYMPDGKPALEMNTEMAANAAAHGVPWGVIEGFAKYTKPTSMLWLGAEDAECWGLMKWNAQDSSSNGIACFLQSLLKNEERRPDEVTSKNANDILCRMNAGTSRVYIPNGNDKQGFSDTYRRACEEVAARPTTPKYAAIDIIMWLMLTDPNILAIKPGTLTTEIMNHDNTQIANCWKCLTIIGMTEASHGYSTNALEDFKKAVKMVRHDTGSVPAWLASRVDIAAAEADKQTH